MSYADITFRDKNPIKRWLQARRLVSATRLYKPAVRRPERICDFGAGNGELCKKLTGIYPDSELVCYEPVSEMLAEAKHNLSALSNVQYFADISVVESGTVDVVFCLEVFEHLPIDETAAALEEIQRILKVGGILIVGVPVEIGIPAIYKGAFRMSRRYGEFDATFRNVALAALRRPPRERPIHEVASGVRFHYLHMGFDFRRFANVLGHRFEVTRIATSPFSALGSWLMPEIYFVAKSRNHQCAGLNSSMDSSAQVSYCAPPEAQLYRASALWRQVRMAAGAEPESAHVRNCRNAKRIGLSR